MAKGTITNDSRIAPIEKMLRQMCHRKGYDLNTVFKGLLDYLLWIFDHDGNKPEEWRFDADDAKMFWEISQAYFRLIDAEMEKGTQWYDAFGDLYMTLHPAGGGKGQFFTPASVCTLTAETCLVGIDLDHAQGRPTPVGHRLCINDPAAGSSRLLLAAAAVLQEHTTQRPYLIAEDLDYNCVKMSAINMAVHGCFGECVCHDSICNPDAVQLGYIINESMWPFPTNVPSIRRETNPNRFVCTATWKARSKAKEQKQAQQPQPKLTEHKQAVQLTLW